MLIQNSLISIIVPVYNASRYIVRCIEQILKQSYRNIELIIINDGSVDNTLEIVNDFTIHDNRLVVLSQENKGVSSARNTGLGKAKGDFVAFIDADDLVETNYVEKLYSSFSNDIDIVVSKFTFEDENGKPIMRATSFLDATICIDADYDFKEPFQQLSVAGVMFRSTILQGTFFDTELSIGEDALFFNEILLKTNKLRFVSDKLYTYVIHRKSSMHKPYSQKKYSEIIAWQKICNLFRHMPLAYSTCLGEYGTRCLFVYKQMILSQKDKTADALFLISEVRRYKKEALYVVRNSKEKYEYKLACISPNIYGWVYRIYSFVKQI